MQIEPMMKAGSSRGKQGALIHGVDVEGRIYSQSLYLISISSGNKSMCGTACGQRSAGWAHMPKDAINCERCIKAIERAEQAKQGGAK